MAISPNDFNATVAIGELGTQFFYFDVTDSKFKYALPLVSGGEYGGDTETFEAPEMDDDTVAKISGRTTLSDITLTSNYTKARYSRWLEILHNDKPYVYTEVFRDGSAVVFNGTAGMPTLQGGDVRQIEATIAPQNVVWIEDIDNLASQDIVDELNAMFKAQGATANVITYTAGTTKLPFDLTSLPSNRVGEVSDEARATDGD